MTAEKIADTLKKMVVTKEGRALFSSLVSLMAVSPRIGRILAKEVSDYLEQCIQPTGRKFHHPKRGTTYREMQGEVRLNTSREVSLPTEDSVQDDPTWETKKIAEDGEMCRLYVDVDSGKPSVRPLEEFHDGRFVEIKEDAQG